MGDPTRGLYDKFYVKRTDGKSEPGQKHENCKYFVLDLTHDGSRFVPHELVDEVSRLGGIPDGRSSHRHLGYEIRLARLTPIRISVIVPIAVESAVVQISGYIGIGNVGKDLRVETTVWYELVVAREKHILRLPPAVCVGDEISDLFLKIDTRVCGGNL